jgi:hypothetical protein
MNEAVLTRLDILKTPTKAMAEKSASQAVKHVATWADALDYLEWNQVNELQTTDHVTDDIPADVLCYIREKIAYLLVVKWELRKRYEICQKAAQSALDEVQNNRLGIEFDEGQAKHGLSQFIVIRGLHVSQKHTRPKTPARCDKHYLSCLP